MYFLVLLAVAISVSSVHAVESENAASHEDFMLLQLECTIMYGVGEREMLAAVMAEDASIVDPCFWSCYFEKTGLLNNKGEYDLITYLSNFKRFGWGEERNFDREAAKQCESVKDEALTDDKNGCERGARVADCFLKYTL